MFYIVEVTTSGVDESEMIGRMVVEERLAACSNILPAVTSYYWWKGKLEKDSESMLFLKTSKKSLDRLIDRVRELHSYENPAIIALPIEKGSPDYLRWIEKETRLEK